MVAQVASSSQYEQPLPEDDIRRYLDSVLYENRDQLSELEARYAVVESYAFSSFPLRNYDPVSSVRLQAVTSINSRTVNLIAVDDNYLDVAFNEYVIVSEVREGIELNTTAGGVPDVIRGVYADPVDRDLSQVPPQITTDMNARDPQKSEQQKQENANYTTTVYGSVYPCIFAESMRNGAFIDTDTKLTLHVVHRYNYGADVRSSFLFKGTSMVRKCASRFRS